MVLVLSVAPECRLQSSGTDGFFALNWDLVPCLWYRRHGWIYLDGEFSFQTANSVKWVQVHFCQLLFVCYQSTYRFMEYWLLSAQRQLLCWANPGHVLGVLPTLELSLAIHDISLNISCWPVVLSLWYLHAICFPFRTVFSLCFLIHY